MALFTNIERGQTPEKMAENDYLMRCESFFLPPSSLSLTLFEASWIAADSLFFAASFAQVSCESSSPLVNPLLLSSSSSFNTSSESSVRLARTLVTPSSTSTLSSRSRLWFGELHLYLHISRVSSRGSRRTVAD